MKIDPGDGRMNGTGAYMKPAGASSHQGAVYTVCGCSGKASGGALNHPAMFISLDQLGSMVIDVTGQRMDVVFLQTNSLPADYFTISKAPLPTNAPAPPTNLLASAVSSTAISLSWADDSDNEAGFKLERSTNAVDFIQFAAVGPGVTNRTDIGLAPETTYFYQVRAFNAVGNSLYSNPAQAKTLPTPPDTTPPAAVTNLTISAVTSNSVSLIWIAPGDDGNIGTAASYDLRYGTNLIAEANWTTATQAVGEPTPAPAGTSQAFTVNGLLPGTIYYFALKTTDETNNLSPISNVPSAATATTILTRPAAPSNLRAVAVSSSEIDVTWKDNANNEDGFKLERSTNGVDFVQIGTPGLNVTNASDQAVLAGSINYYRVRAYNAAGDSPNSNTNSAQAFLPTQTGGFSSILIASNSFWKYLDDGSNQSNAWATLSFNDAAWKMGPAQFGYGFSSEATLINYGPNATAKYITTYFRRHFLVNDPSVVTALMVSVQRDAGAVVYLNGAEVFRSNMPLTGAINYLTPATLSLSGASKTQFYDGPPIDPDELLPGDNVMAVEVHQHSGSSSQMDFDLQLVATNKLVPPRVTLVNSNGQITLSWNAYASKTYRVQYTSLLPTNVWNNLGNDRIATNSAASATDAIGNTRQMFYRVLQVN